jgi:hypothetical protein
MKLIAFLILIIDLNGAIALSEQGKYDFVLDTVSEIEEMSKFLVE